MGRGESGGRGDEALRVSAPVVRVAPALADVSTADPHVAAAVLELALGSRAGVWIAADESRATELTWLDVADVRAETRRRLAGGGSFAFRHVSRFDAALAGAIVTSGDYAWDALVFLPLGADEVDEAVRRVEALDVTREDLGDPGELVTSYGDGTGLLWTRYPLSREQVETALAALAAR